MTLPARDPRVDRNDAAGLDDTKRANDSSGAAKLPVPATSTEQIDLMVAIMASLIEDGDLLAEGIGTFLPTAAYMLAKHTHAPNCTSLCPNGNTLMPGTRTLTLGEDEFSTIAQASVWLDYVRINLVYMPEIFITGKPRWTEFMRPAQIDPWGATNNVCIGPYDKPKVRLPGAAGIPDASTVAHRFYYYVPRHTRQVFVSTLDFCSGAGRLEADAGADLEAGPEADPSADPSADRHIPAAHNRITVITNLCVLSSDAHGRLQVRSLHPGVTREQVQDNTGFELEWIEPLATAVPPTAAQLELLDTVVDPLGLRHLEALTGAARRERLRALVRQASEAGR